VSDLKAAGEETQRTGQRLKAANTSASELSMSVRNLEQQVGKVRVEVERAENILGA
jgi:hypothetical protein